MRKRIPWWNLSDLLWDAFICVLAFFWDYIERLIEWNEIRKEKKGKHGNSKT